ncbi:MAG: FHA domain-containing protein [Planctomycetota bacterium]|jgi:chromosome segregation ATPase
MATLEFLGGKLKGEIIGLKEGEMALGNRRSADIAVRDRCVSFNHAKIHFEDGKYFIEDLKSKGTELNGEALAPNEKKEIPDGATIKLGGEVEAKFSAAGAAPAKEEAPAAAPAAAEAAPAADDGEKKMSARERLAAKRAARKAAAAEGGEGGAAAAEDGAAEGGEKKLSAKDRIALRRKERAEKAAAAAAEKAAKEAEASGADSATVEIVKEQEMANEQTLRDLAKTRRELEEAKKQVAALSEGSAAEEFQKQNEALVKELAEKEEGIHNLELALAESRAGVGATEGAPDERVQKLEAQLDEAQREAAAAKKERLKLTKAFERQTAELEAAQAAAAGDGPIGGYGGAEEENAMLKEALAEKNAALDQLQADMLESSEIVEKLQRRIADYNDEPMGRRSTAEKQLEAMEEKIGEYLEAKHNSEKELRRYKKEYEEFEERVIVQQAAVDDLTERNDIMQYKLEQAEQKVGEIVRGKLVEMQMRFEEAEQTNQQLQSLVEAYEEKIDELDLRTEEMEAENEELEQCLEEERAEHEATKQKADNEQRALRKRLQLAVGEKSTEAVEAVAADA